MRRSRLNARTVGGSVDSGRPSIFAYGAALSALAAMAITARGLPVLGVYAFLILLSGFVRVRLTGNTSLRWVLRVLLIGLVYMTTPDRDAAAADSIGSTHARDLAGAIFSSEMTLQFWRFRPADPYLSGLIILLTSALTILTASNTYESAYICVITPIYLACLGCMAREYRPRRPVGALMTTAGRRRAVLPNVLRVLALAIALAIGGVAYKATVANRVLLTDLGNRLLAKDAWELDMGGMSAQPQLGSVFGLRGSPARVLRIDDFTGDDHFCGFTFTDYQYARWGPPAGSLRWKSVGGRLLQTLHGGPIGRDAATMRVTRIATDNPILFMPLCAATMSVSEGIEVAHGSDTGGPFRVPTGAAGNYVLAVPRDESYQGLFADPLTPDGRAACLKLPFDTEDEMIEVARLAKSIAGRPMTPHRRIELITDYLLTHHKYSLEFHQSREYHDPVASFLLSTPPAAGHCEFFAASACLMLRAVGVPTRYVTGYYVHESIGEGSMIVRQRDAHAWCQAWIDDEGWVTVDATPGDGRPDALADETPIEPWRRVWERMQDAMQAIAERLANITPLETGSAIVALSLLTSGGWLLWVLRTRRSSRAQPVGFAQPDYTSPDPLLRPLTVRFETAWRRAAGEVPPVNRGYADYLRARAADPAAVPPLPDRLLTASAAFAREYEAARFGRPADVSGYGELVRLLEVIEAIEPVATAETKSTTESTTT